MEPALREQVTAMIVNDHPTVYHLVIQLIHHLQKDNNTLNLIQSVEIICMDARVVLQKLNSACKALSLRFVFIQYSME